MNTDGTNTAHSTSAIAISAEPTSFMLFFAASRGARPVAILRSTFSTTTMASSTTMPIASTRPNSDKLLSVKPNAAMRKKVPTSDTGMATKRNDRRAPGLQEQDHHQHDQDDGFADGLDHRVDRLPDELRRIEENVVFDAGRKALRQLLHQIAHGLRGLKRIRAGALKNGERDRRIVIEIGVRRIILRRQFDLGDVLQPHHRARRLLDDDRGELFGIGEPAERLHRDLESALLLATGG